MKKYLKYILIVLASIFIVSGVSYGASFLYPYMGGTGTSTPPTIGQLLVGNSGGNYNVTSTISTDLRIDGNATTTGSMDANTFCISGTNCITAWPTGAGGGASAWEFNPDYDAMTPTSSKGILVSASSTFTDTLRVNRVSGGNENLFRVGTSTDESMFVIKSDGNVGIGTAAPIKALDINGSAKVTDSYYGKETNVRIRMNDASMKLYTGGNVRVRIDGDGNVGISDTDPDSLLEVSASAGSSDLFMLSSDDTEDGDLFIVKNNGNTGIGTTTPLYDLSVEGQIYASSTSNQLILTNDFNNQYTSIFSIDSNGDLEINTLTANATTTFQSNIKIVGNATTTKSFTFTNYTSCNLDTDANGLLVCGTDAVGAGGTGSNWNFGVDQTYITPSTTVGIILNASSTISSNFIITEDLRVKDINATTTQIDTITVNIVKDTSGDLGTAGQVMSSTGSGTNWIDIGSLAESGFVVYGQFSDSDDQTFSANASTTVTFDTNDEILGLTHSTISNTENFIIDQAGIYTLIAQPQVATGPGDSGKFRMWLQKNTGSGFVNIDNTNVELVLTSSDEDVIPLMTTMALSAGDIIRIMAIVDDNGIFLDAQAPAGEPVVPSIICTIFNNIGSQTLLTDADNDTSIEVERTTDDDMIYFSVGGNDAMEISSIGVVTATSTIFTNATTTKTFEIGGDGELVINGDRFSNLVAATTTLDFWLNASSTNATADDITADITTHAADDDAHHALVTITGEDYASLSTQQITFSNVDAANIDLTDAFSWTGLHDWNTEAIFTGNLRANLINATSTLTDTASTTFFYIDNSLTVNTAVSFPNDSITDAMLDWSNFTDLVAGGALDADVVDEAHIADNGINSEHYNDGSIDLIHIAAAAYARDLVTTAPITGGTDNILVGADGDVTIALDKTAAYSWTGIHDWNTQSIFTGGLRTNLMYSTSTLTDHSTTTGNLYLTNLGTAAGTFLAIDGNGMVIATSTPAAAHAEVTLAGQDYLTLSTQEITAGEIEPDDLASSDFGGFDCNGTTCTIDDLFLKNTAADTTAFGLTMGSGTTTDSFYVGTNRVYGENSISFSIASTTFRHYPIIPIKAHKKAITITDIACRVVTATDQDIFISDGTNDTETIACATTNTEDDGSIANGTFDAREMMYIEMGTPAGDPDWLNVTITFTIQ